MNEQQGELLTLVADVVASYVSNNSVDAARLPELIKSVHDVLKNIYTLEAPAAPEKPRGAVPVRGSIKPDAILSMLDGKPYRTLKRHIARHGYTPESYRETFGLPRDYPMVAASYSDVRRETAKRLGLGRKRSGDDDGGNGSGAGGESAAAPAEAKVPAKRGRPRKAQAAAGAG
jgi:predicted transcriptional regulator